MREGIAGCGSALLLLLAVPVASEDLPAVSAHRPEWKIADQSDDPDTGYVMYKRRHPDSNFDAYRLEAVIDAPPSDVAAAARRNVVDTELTGATSKKVILRSKDDVTYIYSYIDLPMMVSDRDVVTRAEALYDRESGVYRLVWTATTEAGPPPKKGVVRLTQSRGSWEFSPLGANQTRAVYENHTDLGGRIPAWIVNPLMDAQVTRNLADLRETVARNRGRGG